MDWGPVWGWGLFVIAQWMVPASTGASCVCFWECFHMHGPAETSGWARRRSATLGCLSPASLLSWNISKKELHLPSRSLLLCLAHARLSRFSFHGGFLAQRVFTVCASVGKVCSITLRVVINTSPDRGERSPQDGKGLLITSSHST